MEDFSEKIAFFCEKLNIFCEKLLFSGKNERKKWTFVKKLLFLVRFHLPKENNWTFYLIPEKTEVFVKSWIFWNNVRKVKEIEEM